MRLSDSLNTFAWDMYQKLVRDTTGDVFFSPYSITVALAMTFAGAKNNTADQMSRVLKLDKDAHQAFGRLNAVVLSENNSYTLRSANRLYMQRGQDLLESFIKTTKHHYQAGLVQLDFRGDVENARLVINEWVSKQTAGKISELIAPGGVDSLTSLVLVNAVYFKGTWSTPFHQNATYKTIFKSSPAISTTVDMMRTTDSYDYFEDSIRKCQVLSLPYDGNRVRMVIILPDPSGSLTMLEGEMTPEVLNSWREVSTKRKVHVHLPRFRIESTFTLNDQLSNMGMQDLFSPIDADLSGISGSRGLVISRVVHKAFVEVNEEGTEAAAATSVALVPGCAPPRPEVIPTFKADRPFICLISHDESGTILFMGRLVMPKGE